MKKRILCLALALCLVAALLPVTALAEETTAEQPEVTFTYSKNGDTRANGTLTLKPGDTKYFVTAPNLGYYSYVEEANKHYFENRSAMVTTGANADNWEVMFTYPVGGIPTVTFRGARIEAPTGLEFSGPGDLKIKVLEDSSITTAAAFTYTKNASSNTTTTKMNYAIYSASTGTVFFEGPGKLTVKTPTIHNGIIYTLGNLQFDNADIHLIDNNRNYLSSASAYGNYGIYAAGNITINGGKLKATAYNTTTTYPANIGTMQSLLAAGGNLTIQNGAKINAVVTNTNKTATPIFQAGGDFTLGNCEMEVANAGSYKGYVFGKVPALNMAEGKYTIMASGSQSTYDAETDILTPPANAAEYVADNATTYRYIKIEKIEEPAAPPAFDKVQVIAGNDLTLNFRISKAEVDAAGGTQVKIERATAAGAAEPKFVPLTEATVEDGFYVIPFTGIAAKEMGDEIAMTVCNAEGEAVSVTRQDSILQYALRMLEGDDAKLKTLIVDMLNYGAMAQDVFDYNEENFVSAALTDEQKALGTQQMAACAANKATVTAAEGFTADVYQGTSFILNNNIAMAMRMSAELGEGSYAKVTFTNYLNKDQEEVTVNAQKLTDGTYAYIYNGLVAADGRCMVTWEFYKADHTKVATVEDSMEQYVGRNVEALPYLAQLMNYSDAAYAYFTAE